MASYVSIHLVMLSISIILYWSLGYYSIHYYIHKYHIGNLSLDKFIKELIWPLRLLYGRESRIITTFRNAFPRDFDVEPVRVSQSNRIGFTAIAGLIPIIYIINLLRATTTLEIISAAAGLLISSYLLYRAWFFGHKLKDMQAAASNEEADTN